MATAVVDVEFRAQLKQLLEEVKKMGPAAGESASRAVDEMATQWKRANRLASRAATEQRKAAAATAKGFDAVKQAAEGMGGRIGGATAMIEKFSRSVSGASGMIGPWGAALAGSSLVMGGFAVAAGMGATKLYQFMTSAVDAAERLSGPMAAGTEDAAAALGVLGGKMETASMGADRLRVIIGGELAPSVGRFTDIVTGASLSLGGFGEVLATAEERCRQLQDATRGVMSVLSVGLVGALYSTVEGWEAEGEAASEAAQAAKAAAEEQKAAVADAATDARDIAKAEAQLAREEEAAKKARARDAQKRREDNLKEEERAAEEMMELLREQARVAETVAAQVAEEEREAAKATAEAWATTYEALTAGSSEIAASMEGLAGAMLTAWVDNTLAVADAISSNIGGSIEALAGLQIDKTRDAFEAEAALREQRMETIRENREEEIAGLLERGFITEAQAKAELKQLDKQEKAREKALSKREREAEKAALRSFRWQRAAQRAQAIIDGARAALSMIPQFSFIPPPGNVLAAATLAATATATQLAVIGAQKPPDFPIGGLVADRAGTGGGSSPDHVTVQAQPTEGILTGRGTAAVGGRAGLDALNSGRGLGPTLIRLEVGSRVVAEAVVAAPGVMDRLVDEIAARLHVVTGQSPIYGRG